MHFTKFTVLISRYEEFCYLVDIFLFHFNYILNLKIENKNTLSK